MRVVVTGATGNIGTSVIEALQENPYVNEIIGVARRVPEEWRPPKTTFVGADVRAPDLARHCDGADAVIHLAWAFQPTHDPEKTWDVNVMGSIQVFEAAAAAGVRSLVYMSSIGAYSPNPGAFVTEDWPTHSLPTAAYGREKAYVERYLDTFELRHPDIRVVRLRPAFAFKRGSGSEQHRIFAGPFVPRAVMRPGRMPVLPVPTGLQFQAVHTDDLAAATSRTLTGDTRGAFNIAAEPVIDGDTLARLFDARPISVPPVVVRTTVGAAWRLRLARADAALLNLLEHLPNLDTRKARSELGWEPRWSGTEALTEMLHGMADGAGAPTAPMQPANA